MQGFKKFLGMGDRLPILRLNVYNSQP